MSIWAQTCKGEKIFGGSSPAQYGQRGLFLFPHIIFAQSIISFFHWRSFLKKMRATLVLAATGLEVANMSSEVVVSGRTAFKADTSTSLTNMHFQMYDKKMRYSSASRRPDCAFCAISVAKRSMTFIPFFTSLARSREDWDFH